MATYIPEDKIEAVKNASDIVEVISSAVLLKKAGKDFVGLCPFHTEKTPSFTVSTDKQIFYCFGCGTGGNVFSFLMKMDGLTFPEAVRLLADKSGIALPNAFSSPMEKRRLTERERLLTINRLAMDFFQERLKNRNTGENAQVYLQNRGITTDTIKAFSLGYAPPGWRNLTSYMAGKKKSADQLEKAGLIIKKKEGSGFYDRFRDRIIFPIFDQGAQVIGFGGRVIDDGLPKYLNSPQTPVYDKSRSLYGIHMAKRKCRQSGVVYLVEGYLDLIALYQNGIENASATLGTSLTDAHVQILKGAVGPSGKAVLVYDSDQAGIKAAERSVAVFQKGFLEASILILPKGHDPDSFLNESGADAFLAAAEKALSLIPFIIETAISKHGLSIDGKVKVVEAVKGPLSAIQDKVARSLYIKDLAERIGVKEAIVLEKIRTTSAGRSSNDFFKKKADFSRIKGTETIEKGAGLHKESRMERKILSMMLQFPEMINVVIKKNILDLFQDDTLKSIGMLIIEKSSHEQIDTAGLMLFINDHGKKNIVARLSIDNENWDRKGCLELIRQFSLGRAGKGDDLMRRIKAAEKDGEMRLLEKLLMEKNENFRKAFSNNTEG